MSNKFIVIGFYTKNTPYEEEIKIMANSCKKFNIEVKIHEYPSLNEWEHNLWIKPVFIMNMMYLHPNVDLLYLDSDAVICEYPILFDNFQYDMGCHLKDGKELLSGTIFLKNNNNTRCFVSNWHGMYLTFDGQFLAEQTALEYMVKNNLNKHNMSFFNLPATYAQIFDSMAHNGKPIIQQNQASRRFKCQIHS